MKTFKGKNNEVLGTFLENTDVVVNPTLSGDEPEMTGIQIGGQKYKAPQGGGASGGSPYVLTKQDLKDITVGAHLDVEATISLIQELGLDNILISQNETLGFSMTDNGSFNSRFYSQPFAFFYYSCASEYIINMFGHTFGVGNENNLITALRSKKADIENYFVDGSGWEVPFIGELVISSAGRLDTGKLLPLEKLRSIFVKYNA